MTGGFGISQILRIVLAIVAGGLLVSCSDLAPQPSSSESWGPDTVFSLVIAEARDFGASERQLSILEEARIQNELTLADLQSALLDTFACFEENGIRYTQSGVEESQGFSRIMYIFYDIPGIPSEDSLSIADDCINVNSYFVEEAYASQPVAVEVYDRYLTEEIRSPLIQCFDELGVPYDMSMTSMELMDVAAGFMIEQGQAYQEAGGTGLPPSTCIEEVLSSE